MKPVKRDFSCRRNDGTSAVSQYTNPYIMHRYFLFNRKRTAVPPASITHTPRNELTEEETSTQLLAGIENLPEKYKEVIILHYIENKTINEIKATIGMSAGTVRNRLSYGLFLLKKYLNNKLNTHA